jgi:gliding motility-associated-like protein
MKSLKILFFIFAIVFLKNCYILAQSPGCPAITPVGATICQGQCANLTATVIPNNATTSYSVASIPYTPFPYTGGTGVSVGTDDVWSSIITLPFNFCFFGVNHTTIKLGSNGQVMFSPASGGGYNNYPVTVAGALPSTANTPGNTINVFRDIDPSEGGNVRYYIGGTAPCRYLVYYYNSVPLYSCGTPNSTFQIVIYENTNYIDIYIGNSSGSCSWQGGRGIVGIQNASGTAAAVAPGRNANSGNWTATNEAWRFVPTGAPSYLVTWFGPGGVNVGSGLGPISVCPTSNTTYTASMVVTNCNGAQTTYTNTALVTVNPSPTVNVAPTGTLNCSGNTVITTTVTPVSTYNWSGPGIVSGNTTGSPTVNQSGIYTVSATAAGCTRTASINMIASPPITLTVNSPSVCSGNNVTLTGAGASTYTWLPGGSNSNPLVVNPSVPTSYTLIGRSAAGCTGTVVSNVSINPFPALTLSGTNPSCGVVNNGVITINNTSGAGQAPFAFASSAGSVSGQTVSSVPAGATTVSITNTFGCIRTETINLTNSSGPNIVTSFTNPSCGLSNGSITFGSPTGGTGPYTYSVNNVSSVSPANGLASGNYSVTVRDVNGCVFTRILSLSNSSAPNAVSGIASPAGCSLSNGSYTITGVTGGTPAYTYSVNGVSTPSVITGLAGGTRTLSVRDNNNCTYTTTINIPQLTGPTAATVVTTNATCGAANGSATVTNVAGGQSPYQYNFNGSGFSGTNNFGSQGAGAYNVIVRDANSCTITVGYNISNAGSPTASIAGSNNVTCFGLSNGSFTASASGGAGAPYTYTLSSPFQVNGTGQFSGVPAGNYLVSVRDASNCVTTTTVNITEPTAVTITPSSIPANCFGTATGTISGSASGGVGPYQFSLNGGAYQVSNTYPTQGAAIYNLTVRDANLCTASQTVQVTQPTALAITLSSQNANCTAANGVASATVSGGTPIYTYNWTGGGGSGSIASNLATGNYSLTATDSRGCVITGAVNVGQTPGGTAAITSSANITCNGLNNGILTVGMTGGSAPFTYSWNPSGQTNGTATNLAPGTYTCEVTDFYGCKAFATGTIIQPSVLTAIMNSNNVRCFGTASGTVIAAGTGGTGPYTYLWPTLASTLSAVSNVPVGNYNVNITDANNCTITSSITVTQPTQVTLSASVTAATCNQANGSATVSASGGTPLYTYTWTTGATGPIITGIGAGTYTISVRDDNNCLQTVAATIPNSAGPSISVISATNVSCFGGNNGSATIQVTGGTAGAGFPIYNWSNGQNTATATNLLMGVYTVSVTDASGCVASTSVNITQPTALTVSITATQPKCFGQANGFGVAAAFGGTPSYTYAWTSTGGNAATSNQLGGGVYGLTVTDANGCVALSSMTLTSPAPMSTSISHTNVSCFGLCNGIAVGTTTNAIGAVSYFWTGGPSAITSQTATGLCTGTYTLLATDQNNCSANNVVTIAQPTQLTANITSSGSVTCNGGNNGFAVVTPAGGTPAYSYAWSGSASANGNSANANNLQAGTYTVIVSDVNACSVNAVVTINQPTPLSTTLTSTDAKCNGSCDGTANVAFSGGAGATTFLWQPGLQSGNFVNNLCAGNQTVTVTYNGSCSTALVFSISQPGVLTAAVTATPTNCQQNNGRVCATTSGGTAPYTYLWSNNANTLCSNNVLAGAYTFSVTDVNLCVATAVALVNDIEGPNVSVLSTTDVRCFNGNDGAATTTITSGVTPYTIVWSANSATVQNVSNFNAGIHNITVIDNAGCIGTASLVINQPTQLVSAVGGFTNVTCFGLSNGSAGVLVNGGTPNYSYTWTPGGQTSNVMANVLAGTYTCQIRDNNNCPSSQVVTISQPQAVTLAASSFSNISCFGGSNGEISTTVQGGTPGYVYTWSPPQAGNSGVHGGLSAGAYGLTVIDTRNCSISANFTILEPAPLTSTFSSFPARCGVANGSATVSVAGGTPGYNVNWNTSPLQAGLVANGMSPGTWNAIVTDSKGCSITQTVSVQNAINPQISGFNVTPPICFGQSNGSINLNYTSGTPNYTVTWSNPISQVQPTPNQSVTVTGVGSGVYTATVTDSYGCVASMPVNVTQPPLVILNTSATQTICFGSTAQIYAQGQGGTNTYTYTWSTGFIGGGPHTVNPTTNTPYNVSMIDGNGCSAPPKVITVVVTPSLSITGSSQTKCHGETVAFAPILVSGGNGGPYNYLWNDGQTTSSISATANSSNTPVQYTVTIDDGCTIPNASAVFTLNVNPLPVISFTASALSGCAPFNVTFFGTSDGANDVFAWSDGNNTLNGQTVNVTINDSGKYSFNLLVTNPSTGCFDNISVRDYISVYPQPIASFYANPQPTTILDPTIYFTNTSQGAVSYFWDFGNPTAPNNTNTSILVNPNHSYQTTGIYNVNLVATSDRGCRDTAMVPIEIRPDFAIYIPNTFSPDGNGVNDMFFPLGVGINEDNYRLDIYDRWGENIFTSNNFRKGWDGTVKGGKLAPQGVYVYKLMVFDLQGNKHPFVGHVTVIRRDEQ